MRPARLPSAVATRLAAAVALAACAVAATIVLSAAPAARASAEPVGPLPEGRVFAVKVLRDGSFVVRAPKRPASSGLVWRIARRIDPAVVRQVAEGEDRLSVWLRFRATGAGTARVVLALTKGETRKAYAARTWVVTVREPGTH